MKGRLKLWAPGNRNVRGRHIERKRYVELHRITRGNRKKERALESGSFYFDKIQKM
jgi:hypothetical protein